MAGIISRCGYRCDLCLIYRDNLKGVEDRKRFRDGLLKYYRHHVALEECYCDGCLTDDSQNPVLITADCRVRACAITRGLETCASCDRYPCGILKRRFIDYGKVRQRFGAPIPRAEYLMFIRPYEGQKELDRIRQKKGPAPKRKKRA